MFPLFSDIKGDIGDESTAANSLVAKGEDGEDNVLAIEEAPPSVSKRFACGAGTIFPCRGKNDEIEVNVADWTQVRDSFDGKSLIMQAASTPLPPSYDEASSTEMWLDWFSDRCLTIDNDQIWCSKERDDGFIILHAFLFNLEVIAFAIV